MPNSFKPSDWAFVTLPTALVGGAAVGFFVTHHFSIAAGLTLAPLVATALLWLMWNDTPLAKAGDYIATAVWGIITSLSMGWNGFHTFQVWLPPAFAMMLAIIAAASTLVVVISLIPQNIALYRAQRDKMKQPPPPPR